jgi:hypothetical protein
MPFRFAIISKLSFFAIMCGIVAQCIVAQSVVSAAEPAKEAEKSSASKPVVTKPLAPTKPADVLAGLPSSMALPPLAGADLKPVVVGSAHVTEQQIVAVSLAGGESAPRSKPRAFVLSTVGDELTSRTWQIHLTPAKKDDPAIHVATWEIKNQKLLFSWSKFAELDPLSELLCNCVFQISAGPTQKKIALRKKASGEKMTLNFNEETVAKWEIPNAPEGGRLKIECDFSFKFPRHRVVGSAILKGSGEDCWIEITEREVAGMLLFHIETKMKSHLELRATPFLLLGDKKMEYSEAAVKKSIAQLEAVVAENQESLKRIQQAVAARNKGKKTPSLSGAEAAQQKLLQAQTAKWSGSLAKLKNVNAFVAAQKNEIPFNARIYFEVDDQLVDLVVTQ